MLGPGGLKTVFFSVVVSCLFSTVMYMSISPTNKYDYLCDCVKSRETRCAETCLGFLPSQLNMDDILSTQGNKSQSLTQKVLNAGDCRACLEEKVLIAVQKGWLCSQVRLGNKMFMIAPAIAAAAKYNATFVMNQDSGDCEWVGWLQELFVEFNTTIPLLPEVLIEDWNNDGIDGITKFRAIEVKTENLTVAGYRQSWKYFSSLAEEDAVRKAFRLTSMYEDHAAELMQKVQANLTLLFEPVFIGVHIRIGDLLEDYRIEYGYRAANTSFYSAAMKTAASYFNNSKSIIFLVATDSPKLAKDMLKDLEKVYNIYWIGGTANEDFATLTKCNHSIISGGTFGFWAAWLAGGKTFYFSQFAKPGTMVDKEFSNEEFYLPSWIPVG